jgi:TM2 domain-containing membrane protein YozV
LKKNLKAALLSAFVFPGLGQLYKGRRLKGGILLILVNILLLVALALVLRGLSHFDFSAGNPEIIDVTKVTQRLFDGTPAFTWISGAFFFVWLYGVLDALLSNGEDHSS